MRLSKKSIRIGSYLVLAYIILAVTWWTILLQREQKALFEAYDVIRSEQTTNDLSAFNEIINMEEAALQKEKRRRSLMIFSEATFIGLGLIFGLWFINRSYRNLVEAERVKQNFLLAISHELKSPIAAIKLSFESLRRLNNPDQRTEEIIAHGYGESNRLHRLVDNVLLATKLDADYVPEMETFDLVDRMNSIAQNFTAQFPKAHITAKSNPDIIIKESDRLAFDIILKNLLENAIKYSNDQIKIELTLTSTDENITFSIRDNGIGIPIAEQSKIFERFYRIGDEQRRNTKGTGIGLYLVKELVNRTAGKISVHPNDRSNGTTFNIIWPQSN